MPVLNIDARRALRADGISATEYVRSWDIDGVWRGDACGCPDDRCAGHHHDAEDECGCLRSILDERKKNAPGAEQSAEGNDPIPEGEIMSIVSKYPALAIANYCATLRKKRSEIEPITSLNDPRVDQLVSIDSQRITRDRVTESLGDADAERHLAEIYFQHFVIPAVEIPIAGPSWAHGSRVLAGDFPNVDIEFHSFPIEMGNVSARWEQVISIAVEDDSAPDGSVPTTPAGTVLDDNSPMLVVTTPSGTFEIEMSNDDVDDMGHVLRVAAGGMHLDTTRPRR